LAVAFMADTMHVAVWSVLEVGVGIVVACCPALRVLLRTATAAGTEGARSLRARGGRGVDVSDSRSGGSRARSTVRMLGGSPGLREGDEMEEDERGVNTAGTRPSGGSSRMSAEEKGNDAGEGTEMSSVEGLQGDISLETIAF